MGWGGGATQRMACPPEKGEAEKVLAMLKGGGGKVSGSLNKGA